LRIWTQSRIPTTWPVKDHDMKGRAWRPCLLMRSRVGEKKILERREKKRDKSVCDLCCDGVIEDAGDVQGVPKRPFRVNQRLWGTKRAGKGGGQGSGEKREERQKGQKK